MENEYVTRVEFSELEGVVIETKKVVDVLAEDKRYRERVIADRVSRKQHYAVWIAVVISALSLISGVVAWVVSL